MCWLQEMGAPDARRPLPAPCCLVPATPDGALSLRPHGALQAAPPAPGQPSPILTYFGMLLEKGKLNAFESLELAKPVIQQGKQALLQKWISEEKLECTEARARPCLLGPEAPPVPIPLHLSLSHPASACLALPLSSQELGDHIKVVDAQLALSVYLRATANAKVIQCFVETGQFDKIMVYCQKVNYQADWGLLLTNIVRVNPQGALDFAQKLASANGVSLDFGVVTDVFMQHNCLQQATSFLLDALKGDKPEEGPLQTRLLEMNLMTAPQVGGPTTPHGRGISR